jgi:hypothetical protein
MLNIEMMYECLKKSNEEDMTTSITTKHEGIDRDSTILWKVFMDTLTSKGKSNKCISGKPL